MRSLLKKSFLYAFVMLFTMAAFSQQTVNVTAEHAPSNVTFLLPQNNPINVLGYTGDSNKNILEIADGSQFYDEEFKKAKISNSKVPYELRYNAYLDEMEIKLQEGSGLINKKFQRNKIVFESGNKTYKILDTDLRYEKVKLGYFEVIQENQYASLYRKEVKELNIGLEKVPYITPAPKIITEFQDKKNEFYVELNRNGHAIKLSKTTRGVSKVFEGKEKEVKAFIKENDLEVKDEQDLIKIINYVNSL
ncbi:hypothetical protein [Kordia sp.]|uniref:hypothetical protein n=1 Tax=Kordia sp. TaxID=1965332 RepID=UPI003B5B3424